MNEHKSTTPTEKIAAFDQVNARSGHDWMTGEQSSSDYFAQARADAVRIPLSAEISSVDSPPSLLERVRRSLLSLFKASP
ncbi:hypothetical protein AB0M32_09735 [Streptomyces sp. NPDC051985]|uniref:hypothetical protein n=1 Tax=Streptomyces sp. NPDC051985 TaxID=3155807 RepID=UPI003413C78A